MTAARRIQRDFIRRVGRTPGADWHVHGDAATVQDSREHRRDAMRRERAK